MFEGPTSGYFFALLIGQIISKPVLIFCKLAKNDCKLVFNVQPLVELKKKIINSIQTCYNIE